MSLQTFTKRNALKSYKRSRSSSQQSVISKPSLEKSPSNTQAPQQFSPTLKINGRQVNLEQTIIPHKVAFKLQKKLTFFPLKRAIKNEQMNRKKQEGYNKRRVFTSNKWAVSKQTGQFRSIHDDSYAKTKQFRSTAEKFSKPKTIQEVIQKKSSGFRNIKIREAVVFGEQLQVNQVEIEFRRRCRPPRSQRIYEQKRGSPLYERTALQWKPWIMDKDFYDTEPNLCNKFLTKFSRSSIID